MSQQKKKKCDSCGQVWPEEFMEELELFTEGSSKIEEKTVCASCAEEFESNTDDLEAQMEQVQVYDPRHLMMPGLLQASPSSFSNSI